MDLAQRCVEAVRGLTSDELDLLAVLALAEPLNITNFLRQASAVGIQRETRAHDTQSLRQLLDDWSRRGLVRSDETTFACARDLRWQLLRTAAARGRLNELTATLSQSIHGAALNAYHHSSQQKIFVLRAALASGARHLEAGLLELAQAIGERDVVISLLVPALFEGFEATWYERLPPAVVQRWLGPALEVAESGGWPLGPIYAYLLKRIDRLAGQPGALLALAGLAIQRADIDALKVLAALPVADVQPSILAALAVLEGRYEEAVALVPMPRKGTPQGSGVVAMLHALMLIQLGTAEAFPFVQRLIAAGMKKGKHLRSSFGVLHQILRRTLSPDADGLADVHNVSNEEDVTSPLLRLLFAAWFEPGEQEWIRLLLTRAARLEQFFTRAGLTWVGEEMVAARVQLGKSSGASADGISDGNGSGGQRRLVALGAGKEAWELSLEGLERLAQRATVPAAEARQAEERLIWRVYPRSRHLEPYIQKRTAGSWTRGRKLAIKHLLPGAPQAPDLAAEDARVAAFAREERTLRSGYPDVHHFFALEAFKALVHHPRVFLEDQDVPIAVVRGQVQLIARSEHNRFNVGVSPPEFSGELQLVEENGRLLVYATDAEALPVLKWVGSGLSFPLPAQPRVLEVLSRLAHLLPVQSFELTGARSVPADPRPWLRIVPSLDGLSVTLSVRPLGQHGPQMSPAEGAPTLLGQIDKENVQAERDLGKERELAAALLTRCPLLEAHRSRELHFELEGADACLDFIAALRDLEPEVHAEWAEGHRLRLRGRGTRQALRGGVRSAGNYFLASGSLEVDAELSLELEELLALVADSPGRFVRLASGDYLELEQELRDTLSALAASRSEAARSGAGKKALKGVPIAKSALAALDALTAADSGFQLDVDTRAYRQRIDAAFERRYPVPRRLEAELRPYQQEGFRWLARLAELSLSACLADDMGLGKTVQIVALLLHRAKTGPALVVAPTSVCDNWRDELLRFAPSLRVRWYLGAGREAELEGLAAGQVVITTYGLLQQDIERLQSIEFGTAVLDEAQFIKNSESQRARAAYLLNAGFRVAATGTPVENHVGDLFGLFQFLLPDLLGARATFSRRFKLDAEGEAGAQARQNLRRILQPFILRRTKAQVLIELPGVTEVRRSVTLTAAEAALYESVRRAALARLVGTSSNGASTNGKLDPRDRFQVLAELTRLRRLCCHPELVAPGASTEASKLSSFLELVDELIQGRHRALVFSQFVDMLALVRAALDARNISYQYLDGSTPTAQRKSAVESFQAGDGELFLISLRAGGFGLNLTGADYVIHLDPWWNPAVEAQATDRAHRIGQTRPVTVYRLITQHTIEERIIELHRTKRDLADSLLEDSDRSAKLTADELRSLLEG
jgi:superfamily II DNA or RNA helicase